MSRRLLWACIGLAMTALSANASEPVLLHAAGSLRAALNDVSAAYEVKTKTKVQAKFGASGLLKDEISGGARAEVFASANMAHPQALSDVGKSGPVVLFARNRLCALVRPGLTVTPANLPERMLESGVKLATSTPKADPSGDYAFAVFAKAEPLRAGAKAALEGKAPQLTGGPNSPQAPAGKSIYGLLVGKGEADIFLTYCTNAVAAKTEYPEQQIVALPDNLAVGADYGLTVLANASADAYRFALYILSTDGQRILAKHGFAAPDAPQQGESQ